MSTKKPNFQKGFNVAHHQPKQTAMDKFQAAEAFVNAEAVKPDASDRLASVSPKKIAKQDGAALALDDGKKTAELSPEFGKWARENNYQRGTVLRIKLDHAKPSRFNPRHFYNRQSISALAVNIHSQEQQQPILVTPDSSNPGEFFVVDGGRRIRALRESGEDTFRALVVDVPQGIESYKLGYDLNTQHDSQTVFDNAVSWKLMLEENLFTSQTALADFVGVDKSEVTATLAISDLPHTLVDKMVDHREQFGMNMAYNITKFFRVKGEKATDELISRAITEGLSVRRVAEITRKAIETAPPGAKSTRTRYAERVEIRFDEDVPVGTLQTYADGRLELKLKGLSKDQTDKVHHRLQETLAEFNTKTNAA